MRSGLQDETAPSENEIKAPKQDLRTKLRHLNALVEFDRRLCRRFDMPREPLDKYHRCASFFRPH